MIIKHQCHIYDIAIQVRGLKLKTAYYFVFAQQ